MVRGYEKEISRKGARDGVGTLKTLMVRDVHRNNRQESEVRNHGCERGQLSMSVPFRGEYSHLSHSRLQDSPEMRQERGCINSCDVISASLLWLLSSEERRK
jgi:hypothetical protein